MQLWGLNCVKNGRNWGYKAVSLYVGTACHSMIKAHRPRRLQALKIAFFACPCAGLNFSLVNCPLFHILRQAMVDSWTKLAEANSLAQAGLSILDICMENFLLYQASEVSRKQIAAISDLLAEKGSFQAADGPKIAR